MLIGTVTCRQFSNLTFAPRKTRSPLLETGNLTLHSYHATAKISIHWIYGHCKTFFQKIVFF